MKKALSPITLLFVLCTPLLAVSLPASVQLTHAATRAVGPADDWCAMINAAQPGAEIVFASGSYNTPCAIRARGTAAQPIVLRSASTAAGMRATFAYTGTSSNVLDLQSVAFLTLRGFAFTRTEDDIDAVRIRQGNDVVIEANIFENIGGIAIPANSPGTTSSRITVRENRFVNMRNTVVYFGCHPGDCAVLDARVERNLIDGTLPGDGVGYGVQFKLNSHGVILDNAIYRTRGPGIMVYGDSVGSATTLIEGNYVEGAIDDANINAGGGPAIVRNNVSIGGGFAGIRAQNYANRNLQRNVRIVHNTVLSAPIAGIHVQGWSDASNVLANNAIAPIAGIPVIDGVTGSAVVTGNVTCDAACFVNSGNAPFDLLPAANSALLNTAGTGTELWRPRDDFMGETRGSPADAGAFERVTAPLPHTLGNGEPRPPRRGGSGVLPTAVPSMTPAQNTPGPVRAYLPYAQRP